MVKTVASLVKIKIQSMAASAMSVMRGRRRTATGISFGTLLIIVLVAIAFLAMMVFAFAILSLLLFQTKVNECEWYFFAAAAMVAVIFSLVGSVFAAQSYLFEATDNDLLLSMPVNPSAVLLSRILTLFLLNCVYSYLIMIPQGISYGLFIHFTPLSLIYYILSLILIPAAATALSSICGYILGIITDKLPSKNIVIAVFSIGLLAVLILVTLNFSTMLNDLVYHITDVAQNLKNKFPPLYWYGMAMSKESPVLIIPTILICTVPMLLVFWFLSKKFIKIVTRKKAMKKKKYVEKPMHPTNIRTAMIKKEVMHFFSLPGYVMNAGFSTIMAVMFGLALIWRGDMISESLAELFPDSSGGLVPLVIGCALSMCCIMNDVTAPSISLEGRTMWLLKSTPVRTMDVFWSKAVLAPIVSLPGVIFTAIVSAICLPLKPVDVAFIILAPLTACMFSGFLGVCINLRLPRFDWTTEITVIKQSLSVIVTLLVAMLFTIVPFLFALLPTAYFENFSYLWSYGICVGYFMAMSLLEIFYLATDGRKIFAKFC